MIWNEALEQYVNDHQDEVVELIRTLVAIPAFSNHEQARAEFCAKWFRDVGAEDVKIDEANNVIVTLGDVQAGKAVAFMAHLDTVFPDETGFELVEEDGWLKAPFSDVKQQKASPFIPYSRTRINPLRLRRQRNCFRVRQGR